MGILLLLMLCGVLAGDAPYFTMGPVPGRMDLRNMMTSHVVQRSCAALDELAVKRREAAESGEWGTWRQDIRRAVSASLGEMPFGEHGGPLNIRPVSRHEREHYTVENVLFESLPGLDVNASVYLPLEEAHPKPWPAVVIPVGHSAKTRESYQKPAQYFARSGFVAVTFDPPGMGGEKHTGNDHFRDGVRCYLTGHSSNRYFVIDALRCIDYLETRADVDTSRGVAMTGVSGGGITTMYATVLDDRIRVSGPSCCAVPKALHPVLDAYAECPETLPFNSFNLFDTADLLLAALDRPLLLMAGAVDEVFPETMTRAIAEEIEKVARAAGEADRFDLFLDPGGHAYTVAMAKAFAQKMAEVLIDRPAFTPPDLTGDDLEMLPDDLLACHPRQDRNIFSVNRDLAAALQAQRVLNNPAAAIRKVVSLPDMLEIPVARSGAPALVWFHYIQELAMESAPDIDLPATYLYPAREGWKGPVLLYFDDRGRWTDLRSQGMLCRVAGFIDESKAEVGVLSVDLRGWGDSRAADLRYDLAGWGSREQWLSYVSAALGDHLLAMRIRDGLSALFWLKARDEVTRVAVAGRGMGGVVALHLAALDPEVAGAACIDSLASFEMLAATENYRWNAETFLPGVLQHYDLPGLAAAIDRPVLIVNPLDALREPLTRDAVTKHYTAAIEKNNAFRVITKSDDDAVLTFLREILQN